MWCLPPPPKPKQEVTIDKKLTDALGEEGVGLRSRSRGDDDEGAGRRSDDEDDDGEECPGGEKVKTMDSDKK